MKKLLLASLLGLTLSFPFNSFAGVNVFGVDTPVERKNVRDNVKAGYVAKNLGDTFHVQKPGATNSSGNSEDRDEYLVFSVDIKSLNNRI